jgi:uncharacterized protein YecE (DUF72 family)
MSAGECLQSTCTGQAGERITGRPQIAMPSTGGAIYHGGMRLCVGTSGYNYDTWKGEFYPAKLSRARMLAYYGERFPTVEINYTFRTLPSARTLAGWAAQTPEGFRFALKAWQRITHHRRLRDVAEPVGELHGAAAVLGEKLGPVLYQLPPNLGRDDGLLDAFLAVLPRGARAAMEFRHPSWLDERTYRALAAAGVALCVADAPELSVPLERTAGFGYLRLRRGDYDDAALGGWAERIARAGFTDEVYVYFKHEDEPTGPRFAARLVELARAGEAAGVSPRARSRRGPAGSGRG